MVPMIMAPVAPSGWPIAMAPPLTLSFSSGMLMSFWNFSTTDGEGLVHLEQVDVVDRQAGPVERLAAWPASGR